ncbi:DUF4397 domain-containing protein [Kineococcus rhizosphaerae]|uniref:Uncharacterized protein DUF4397 n=1 Tax=Kineococcus rhizosphaerae TaxID=559628 RepID=A0A2T0R5I6_9ACTN|nr:DUF4397 domain-containing protein [Kineococcus rhizosphaerae]PRY15975.1 uncharacterized protein DUF4397 [Kineococcus rhizosphaerae]
MLVTPPRARPQSRAWAVVVAVLALLLVSLSCARPASAAVPGDAWVRAAHLVPGLGAMEVTARPAAGGDPVVLAASAAYGDVAPYQRLTPGDYTVELRPAGAALTTTPVLSSTFSATSGAAYTLAGLGSLQSPRLATLQDDLTPPAPGTVSVRLLPAASSAAAVTVQAANGPVLAQDAVFGQPTRYASVPAGKWTLQASAEGLAAASTDVDLTAGGIYTLAVVDRDGGLGVQVVTDAAGAATMPVGGAQTGGGGTASGGVGSTSWVPGREVAAGLAAFLVVGGLGLLARRRATVSHAS